MSEAQLSRREKAVAVAKDVLKHVRDYRWGCGMYISSSRFGEPPWTGDLQDHVEEVQKGCRMCLLGACLVSKARLFNAVPIGKLYKLSLDGTTSISPTRETIEPLLQDIFSPLELAKIESAFERRVMGRGYANTTENHDLLRGAALFGKRIDNDAAHVVTAVMENIIANDGTFVVEPTDEEAYGELMWLNIPLRTSR